MVEQGQDDPGSSGVGQCTTQAVHHVETRSNSQHALNYTARAEHSVTGVSPDRTPVRGSFTARRLARSLPDARDIAGELTIKGVALSLGGSVYDPNDAVGRLLFNVLGMVAEFEADLIRLRTREGIGIARSKGKLKGKKPKFSPSQRKHLLTLHTAGEHTQAEFAELFNVSRTTIYRELRRTTADT